MMRNANIVVLLIIDMKEIKIWTSENNREMYTDRAKNSVMPV